MVSKSQVKYIQSLGQKKQRDEDGMFVAEGPKLIEELLNDKPRHAQNIFALEGWIDKNKKLLEGIPVTPVDDSELGRISQMKMPNQVLAIFKKFDTGELIMPGRVILLLDEIQDPGNLGTIIRIADWFAISQLVCSHGCADAYNSKVVQASMGSIGRVEIFHADLPVWLGQNRSSRVYGAFLEGKDVTKMNPISEGVVVIGNESKGIDKQVLEHVNEKITIPGRGRAESLNAAVAAGIILSHLT